MTLTLLHLCWYETIVDGIPRRFLIASGPQSVENLDAEM